jgi:midasin
VEAVRNGYWIILDELNLAPSDVLEALNRLLDDNRELFIPETQEVVHPHSRFRLFATQNPPGVYGGRKYLSRAFRNRFLEINIGDIPTHEWEVSTVNRSVLLPIILPPCILKMFLMYAQVIISRRCALPPSHATLLVGVMSDLQRLRQASDVFKGKDSFASPRDLLRWASRHPESKQALAEEG